MWAAKPAAILSNCGEKPGLVAGLLCVQGHPYAVAVRVWTEQLKNGETRYVCRVQIDGKKRTLRHKLKRDLVEEYETLKANQRLRRRGLPNRQGPVNYNALCDKFLDGYPNSARAKHTLETRLRESRKPFGKLLVRDLTPDVIEGWNARLDVSANYRHALLAAMNQVMKFGVNSGYLDINPVEKTRKPRLEKTPIHPFESWAEVEKVAGKANGAGALIRFAVATGLRPQEWQALRWDAIDLGARRLNVTRTVRSGKLTDAKAKTHQALRTVALQARAIDALKETPEDRREGFCFLSPAQGMIDLHNWSKRVWQPALADAHVEYRPAGQMRHSFRFRVPRSTSLRYVRWIPMADDRWLDVLDSKGTHDESNGSH